MGLEPGWITTSLPVVKLSSLTTGAQTFTLHCTGLRSSLLRMPHGLHSQRHLNNEEQIVKDLIECQGPAVDVGGYYKVDQVLADKAMRPSQIFNDLMDKY